MKLGENNQLNLKIRTKEFGELVSFSLIVTNYYPSKQNLVTNILNSK